MGAATVMLRDVHSGLLLAVGLDPARAELARSARGDDRAMWRESASESGCFVSATVPGLAVRGLPVVGDAAHDVHNERRWRIHGAVFDEVFAPTRLPSEHLEELRTTGITVLPGFSPAVTDLLREAVHATSFVDAVDLEDPRAGTVQLYTGGRFGSGRQIHVLRDGKVEGGLAQAPLQVSTAALKPTEPHGSSARVEVTMVGGGTRHFGLPSAAEAEALVERLQGSSAAEGGGRVRNYLYEGRGYLFGRVHTHPVVLWILESYFGTPVRASHTPGAKVIMPQDGSLGPGQGWHSDTPVSRAIDLHSLRMVPARDLCVTLSCCRRRLWGHCHLIPQYDKGLRGLPHGKTWQVDDTGRIRNTQEGVEAFEAWPDPSRPLGESNTESPKAAWIDTLQLTARQHAPPTAKSATQQPIPRGCSQSKLTSRFANWTGLQCNVCIDPFTVLNGGTGEPAPNCPHH